MNIIEELESLGAAVPSVVESTDVEDTTDLPQMINEAVDSMSNACTALEASVAQLRESVASFQEMLNTSLAALDSSEED